MARAEQPTATASRASRRAKVGPPGSSAQSAAGEVAEPSTAAQLVVISGLSGAGKSQASKLFEDLGYYCVDNLPPELLDGFLALRDADPARYRPRRPGARHPRRRSRRRRSSRHAPRWRQRGTAMQVIFLEASDTALVSRFSETRHRHPLQARSGVQAGIAEERRRLAATRELADHVIDTSSLSIGQLKERLIALLPRDGAGRCGPDRHHHLRLQVRHPAGGGPRLRRPLPDQSVLGAGPQAALRPAGAGARVRHEAADRRSASSTWSPSCWS